MRIPTLIAATLAGCAWLSAQTALPAAPDPHVIAALQNSGTPQTGPATQTPASAPATAAPDANLPQLTLAQAEQMAIRNNPRVSVGKLVALGPARSHS